MADTITLSQKELKALIDVAVNKTVKGQTEGEPMKFKPEDLVLNLDGNHVTPDELEESNKKIEARRKAQEEARKEAKKK